MNEGQSPRQSLNLKLGLKWVMAIRDLTDS